MYFFNFATPFQLHHLIPLCKIRWACSCLAKARNQDFKPAQQDSACLACLLPSSRVKQPKSRERVTLTVRLIQHQNNMTMEFFLCRCATLVPFLLVSYLLRCSRASTGVTRCVRFGGHPLFEATSSTLRRCHCPRRFDVVVAPADLRGQAI